MKKYIAAALVIVTAAFVFASMTAASDITGARYAATIRVSNNGTATENLTAVFTLDTQTLIDFLYMEDGADVAIVTNTGGDVAFQPSVNGSYPWVVFVPEIGDNGNLDYVMYTGNTSNGKYRYSPGNAGMEVADNASLEISDNFTIEISGYFGSSDNIVVKDGAISIYTDESGNLTAGIYGSSGAQNVTLYPIGEGAYTNMTASAGANWECVDDPTGAPDDDTTYVYAGTDAQIKDAYTLTDASELGLDEFSIINSVTVYYRFNGYTNVGNRSQYVQPFLRLDGAETTGTETNQSGVAYGNHNEALGRPGGGSWTVDDLDNLQLAMGSRHTSGVAGSGHLTQAYVVINYYPGVSINPGIVIGEGSLSISGNTTDLKIYVNGIEEDSAAIVPVPDVSANWTFAAGMLYMEAANITIDGELRGSWKWEYGTTFTDLSGNGNDAFPSFRTTGSSANVTAQVLNFGPTSQAQATASSISYEGELVDTPPDEPSTMYSDNSSAEPGFFMAPLINELLDAFGIPRSLFWYPFAYIIVIASGAITFRLTQSLTTQAVIMGALLIFFALPGLNILGLWTLIYFGFEAIGVIVMSKHFAW